MAQLHLDKFQLLWLCEGAIGKSHLRWDIYKIMVNDVFPQLNDDEREFIFTYLKRDLSWHFNNEMTFVDKTPKEYFLQLLARYNPVNQYIVKLTDDAPVRKGDKREIEAYLWQGRYYTTWNRYCAPEYIKKVEKKPFKKCINRFCNNKDKCVRNCDWKESDIYLEGREFSCEHCDFFIADKGEYDPIAKMKIW